ncbi:MAG TPA: HAMP domain-containing sensor histidine kinase [Candidatus Tyrphobacter sp.]
MIFQRSIASRLSMLYAVIFGVTLLIVVLASSIALVAELSHFEFELMIGKREEARVIAQEYRANGLALSKAAPEIVQELSNLGTRVAVFDEQGNYIAGDRSLHPVALDRIMARRIAQLDAARDAADLPRLIAGTGPFALGVPESGANLLFTLRGSPQKPAVFSPATSTYGVRVSGNRVFTYSHVVSGSAPTLLSHFGPPPRGLVSVDGGFVVIEPSFLLLLGSLTPYWLIVIGIAGAAIVIAWFGGRLVATQALRPLNDVTDSLHALAQGDYTQRRFVMAGGDEIATLTGAYNDAAASVASAMEQRRATEERMRLFVADAGHELRTPLTVIGGYIDVLRRGAVEEVKIARQILGTMAIEKEHMRGLIDRLMRLARLDADTEPHPEPIDVVELLRTQCEAARRLDEQRAIDYRVDGVTEVVADRVELGEALWNVVENALKYAPESPIHLAAAKNNGHTTIAVVDEGPGMTEPERLHAFERFYRGDQRGEIAGSGLGLAIAKRAVERAGGKIAIESVPGRGTTVTIML